MSTGTASKTVFDKEHETSENNANEHQRLPLGRKTTPCSCQSASDHVEAAGRAIREASPERTRYSTEYESLHGYASEKGLVLPTTFIPDRPAMAGQEHDVWPSLDQKRVYKATMPTKFGVAINYDSSVPASIYFRRMSLTNQVFGDDIQFEGIVMDRRGLMRVVISQPLVIGRVTTPEEVIRVMGDMGFNELEINGATAWYREEDNILAFDAHTHNFLTTDDGTVIPIDVNLHQPDEEMKAAFKAAVQKFCSGYCDPAAPTISNLKVIETVA